ncbi:MAG: KEOPS complex subunit Cgi121 [Thermoplasmata archaeon]
MLKFESDDFAVWAIPGRTHKSKEELLRIIAELGREKATSIQLIDSKKIFGRDHLRAAFEKTVRSFRSERNVSDSPVTEMMLYLSGCRQIQEALDAIGLKEQSKSLILLSDREPGDISKLLSLEEDESVLSPEGKDVRSLGISDIEISTVREKDAPDLVLERVASVDVRKK